MAYRIGIPLLLQTYALVWHTKTGYICIHFDNWSNMSLSRESATNNHHRFMKPFTNKKLNTALAILYDLRGMVK